jgi:excisionase family DNA binding protein
MEASPRDRELREFLTPAEVAEQLGVTADTVLADVRDGRLRAVRLSSRTIRFRREDIEALGTPDGDA